MCPLYPLHHLLTYGFLLLVIWAVAGSSLNALVEGVGAPPALAVNGSVAAVYSLNLTEKETQEVTFYLDDLPPDAAANLVIAREDSSDGLSHLEISPESVSIDPPAASSLSTKPKSVQAKFNVSGTLLGFSKIQLVLSNGQDKELIELSPNNVKVHKGERYLDKIFIHVVILLVVITYINMGCAIDLQVIKECLMRPIGPSIGIVCQYLFMPLAAFGLGYALFPSTPELWLGLFITGCAPGGGGSNMWTYLLDGNLNLSITMTLISTLVAFGALPLWIFLLGRSVFADGYYGELPYKNIAMLVLGLVIPCGIGILIKHFLPKVAAFLVRMLKALAVMFILVVMTFGVYANLYMFSFFNWKVILSGFCLPFFGFAFGAVSSLVCRRKWEDVVAISVETGIQNSGIAIGVIKIALREFSPLDDIAMVLPVAVSCMTPLPLALMLIWKKINDCRGKKTNKQLTNSAAEEGLYYNGSPFDKGSFNSETPMVS